MKLNKTIILKYIQSKGFKYKKSGNSNWVNICNPFIKDDKFHFGINVKDGYCNCFKTNIKYSFVDFVAQVEKCTVGKVWEILGVEEDSDPLYELTKKFQKSNDSKKILKLPESTIPLDVNNSKCSPYYNYIFKRLKDHELISSLHLQCCLSEKYWHDYLIIPYYENNQIVYYIGRNINNDKRPKYRFPSGFRKSDFIYNQNNANNKALIICEGQLNATIVNGIALGGCSIDHLQMNKILTMKPKSVIVALDQNNKKIQKKGILLASQFKKYLDNVYFYQLPTCTSEDFVDFGRKKSFDMLKKYIYPLNPINIIKFS